MKLIKNMKHYFPIAGLLVILLVNGCGKEDEPTPQEKATDLLIKNPWQIHTVDYDGTDQTAEFDGLVLTFTSGQYTASEINAVWPTSGTWAFADNSITLIVRDGDLDITVEELSESTLVLSFYWNKTTFGTGKVRSVPGPYVFTFRR